MESVNDIGEALQAHMRGPVLTDGDAGYDALRVGYNAMYDQRRPAAIARCTGAADVQAALAFARERELTVAVRSAGHSLAAACTIDGGLLIELGLMQSVRVDPRARTAYAAAGVTWGLFDRETQAHGLATTGGVVSTTGVAGLTLGGGVGRLMREHGLTCDNVRAFDVVLADGSLVTASADSEPDLFWALRGGGGNFGIVTGFEYNLHPIGPNVLGGTTIWPFDQVREVLAAGADLLDDPPEQLSVQVVLTSAPSLDFLPQEIWGKEIVAINFCWTGDLAEGERLLAGVRGAGVPVVDAVSPMPYAVVQSLMDVQAPFGRRTYIKSGYLAGLSEPVLDIVEKAIGERGSAHSMIEIYLMGGAVARVATDATAFAQRSPKLFWSAVGMWEDAGLDEHELEWSRATDRALAPHSLPGRYINFVADADEESIRAALGGDTYDRLNAVKRRYDPDHVFWNNPNVREREPGAAR